MSSDASAEGDLALPVAAVARRLGVAPATLRTWDRRYGLGPSVHEAGAHRRYSAADLARLTVMRRLTLEGLPTAEAARRARAVDEPSPTEPLRRLPSSTGGGPVLALGKADAAARGLARAAMALDGMACVSIAGEAITSRGLVQAWDEVIVPALVAAGERYATTGEGIDVEHLLSEAVSAVLKAEAARATGVPTVLLASAEDDLHCLPVHALAAGLAAHDVSARVLGARTPAVALAAAVRRTRPAAIFVWSQIPATGNPAQLSQLPRLRPQPRLHLGGPGWHPQGLPPGAERPGSLQEALQGLLDAVGR